MDTKTILVILAVAVCVNCELAFYYGQDESLNDLCAVVDEVHYNVYGPDACDLRTYVMCFKGQAVATNRCAGDQRFNLDAQWCDLKDNVPLPEQCSEDEVATQAPAPNTEKDLSVVKFAGLSFPGSSQGYSPWNVPMRVDLSIFAAKEVDLVELEISKFVQPFKYETGQN